MAVEPVRAQAALTAESDGGRWSPDLIAAQLAAGAERDQLAHQVAVLQAEVQHLRVTLAKVLEAVAQGMQLPSGVVADNDVGPSTGESGKPPLFHS